MKHRHPVRTAVILKCAFSVLVTIASAQDAPSAGHVGVPQDWTQHHLVFGAPALARHPELFAQEPRVGHLAMQRWRIPAQNLTTSIFAAAASPKDWSVSLGAGRVAADMFPAKYGYDPSLAPSCSGDFAVFGLNVIGVSGGRVNLAAFNNLYSGTGGLCGALPTVLFAYDVSTPPPPATSTGRVMTSPVLSLDGKQIAFVESQTAASVFHVLTWSSGAGNGAIGNAAVPGTGNSASMTSLTYDATSPNTRSSPWVDYRSHTAYVGADDGKLYKILNVFNGTPALAGAPWPVTLSTGFILTAPVYDSHLGVVLVGSRNGTLYAVNGTSGAVKSIVVGKSGQTNPAILAPPIVDVTYGTVFVVSSNDGTQGVLVEVDTATMTQLAKASLGVASHSGTVINIYQPAFSNNYYSVPTTGDMRVCGTGANPDTTPWEYEFGFTLNGSGQPVLNTTPLFSQRLVNSPATHCSGWSEFFNPNIGTGGTDFFFFGLNNNCIGLTGAGCVLARPDSGSVLTHATITGGPSSIIIDNWSTAPQASSIYFTSEGGAATAYKFTQSGLLP